MTDPRLTRLRAINAALRSETDQRERVELVLTKLRFGGYDKGECNV